FVAALGSTLSTRLSGATSPVDPSLLWIALAGGLLVAVPALIAPQRVGRLLSPLRAVHQEWVDERLDRLTSALARFKGAPAALVGCFAGSIGVQVVLVGFYAAIARALHLQVPTFHLAVLIPLSFIVQMMPLSVNGLGVREWVFGSYFTRVG